MGNDGLTMTITARNAEQAEYLVRSRAEQRGINIAELSVTSNGKDSWLVKVVTGGEAQPGLDDDTQVLRLAVLNRQSKPSED